MTKKISLILSFLLVLNCSKQQTFVPFERVRVLMDTFVQISIFDRNRSETELEHIVDLAFQEIAAIERLTNVYDDSSVVSLINREAGFRAIDVDSSLQTLLEQSRQIYELSNGAFDITIQSVKQLWNFSQENPRIPGDSLLQSHLRWVGMNHLLFQNNRLQFDSPEVKIDLGGIAKGYAVDRAIQVLKQHGITDAMVNAGGDLQTIASDLTKGKRRVWIKHPREADRLIGYFPMDQGCVATSGDYERFFEYDCVRYHHILDPKTGYPARGCVSVTIKAPTTTLADGLATAVFVLGPEEGMALIERLPEVEGVIIHEQDGKLKSLISTGLNHQFKSQ